jgi:hypothetical protein
MSRKACIDDAGVLHHVIDRGIEKHDIFADEHDRNNHPSVCRFLAVSKSLKDKAGY